MSKGDRQRRLRERQRRGEFVVPVVINHDVVETAINLGWLAVGDSEDRDLIGAAIGRLLQDLAAARKP